MVWRGWLEGYFSPSVTILEIGRGHQLKLTGMRFREVFLPYLFLLRRQDKQVEFTAIGCSNALQR